jgi:hypothetical protein
MYQKNLVNVAKYTWEIDSTKPANTITGTIPIFSIDAKTVIKKVTALVRQAVTGYDTNVMASATDINHTTNIFTSTAHGYVTGVVGQMSTSSALPTGLSTSTDYYVINLSANTFALAASAELAAAGTKINITDAGTGNQTFTPTALSVIVGDGDDTDGFLKATFADATGYVGASYNDALQGDYQVATGFTLEKYYAAADTIDFIIAGQAKQGKIDFYVEYLGL